MDGDPSGSGPTQVNGTILDITLRNRAAGSSLITRAELTFTTAEYLEPCTAEGGPIVVSANYDVLIPDDMPPTPFMLTKDVRYEVPSNSHERFTLSVGPRTTVEGSYPFVSAAEVVLLHDDGKRLPLGRFALINTGNNPSFYPESALDPTSDEWVLPSLDVSTKACMARNAKKLDAITASPNTIVSKEFASLVKRLDQEGL